MDTLTLNGNFVRNQIKSRFGSVDRMIANSNGMLTPSNRSAIFRGIDQRPIERHLVEAIAELLGTSVAELVSERKPSLRLTKESYLFNSALRLLRQRPIIAPVISLTSIPENDCIGLWLKERLNATDNELCWVLAELTRIGHIQQSETEVWVRVTPTIRALTRSLKRRVECQWPIVRDALTQNAASRRRTSRKLIELIDALESHVLEPLAFFCLDDEIHEGFCTQPSEVEIVRVSRAASWAIAHDLILELTAAMAIDPTGATASMKSIAGWMIEDYVFWADRLAQPEVRNLSIIRRGFRHHVLRMRDHAQYYRDRKVVQGSGI